MTDSLSNLKEKYTMHIKTFNILSGVMSLDALTSFVMEIYTTKYKLADKDMLARLHGAIDCLHSLKAEWHNKECDWCTLEEWVYVGCWSIFKRPSIFRHRWSWVFGAFFDVMDEDRDSFINEEDFGFFYRLTKRADDKDWIARAFKAVDTEQSGKLSKSDYISGYVRYFSDPDITYADLPLF